MPRGLFTCGGCKATRVQELPHCLVQDETSLRPVLASRLQSDTQTTVTRGGMSEL